LASSRQYGNALLRVRHPEEEEEDYKQTDSSFAHFTKMPNMAVKITENSQRFKSAAT